MAAVIDHRYIRVGYTLVDLNFIEEMLEMCKNVDGMGQEWMDRYMLWIKEYRNGGTMPGYAIFLTPDGTERLFLDAIRYFWDTYAAQFRTPSPVNVIDLTGGTPETVDLTVDSIEEENEPSEEAPVRIFGRLMFEDPDIMDVVDDIVDDIVFYEPRNLELEFEDVI